MLQQRVNSFLSMLFVGVSALGASYLMMQAAEVEDIGFLQTASPSIVELLAGDSLY